MRISEDTLRQAWHRRASETYLLDDDMFPPVCASYEQYEDHELDETSGLHLVLEDDGSVSGYAGRYDHVFLTRDLDETLYRIAEEAVRRHAESVTGRAALLDRIDPAWGRRFRGGGVDGSEPAEPCGLDPLEGFAWIAGSWHDQEPYTTLTFFRGGQADAERIALLHGADPEQVAAGTTLADLRGMEGDEWDTLWRSCAYGQAGDWAFLLHHENSPGTPGGREALAALGITETVRLSACSAKAIYTFDYLRDGRRVEDDENGVIEMIWYDHGRAPFDRGGPLDFLNRALRRAELDHPELEDEFALYFHALETSLGLGLPRRAIEEGTVRAAQWARHAG
ncbi:hypothetical protein [Streptomyces sp. SID5910]|uniref:hypothetical protein n=1 Tax=Streptomyces sp. SID5910 TaxID=2690312 RepID=UPI001372055D|nr:hypothetical protein [Streptomyces sp. SID5910]MYR43867.1 hypothetical protein [Streptomyces sp. SID5910]